MHSLLNYYSHLGFAQKILLDVKIRLFGQIFYLLNKEIPNKATVLDFGCGYGVYALFLGLESDSREILGIDTDYKRIICAEKASVNVPNLSFRAGSIDIVRSRIFDVIYMIDVFHHIPFHMQHSVMKSVRGLCHQNSKLIIIDVDPTKRLNYFLAYALDTILYPFDERCHFLRPDQMHSLLLASEFKYIKVVQPVRQNILPDIAYIVSP